MPKSDAITAPVMTENDLLIGLISLEVDLSARIFTVIDHPRMTFAMKVLR
jgi:hypothetical protein